MGELLLGCSGWNYGDTSEKGGWVGVFYPDRDTKTQSQLHASRKYACTFHLGFDFCSPEVNNVT
jgi:hypothetical protein